MKKHGLTRTLGTAVFGVMLAVGFIPTTLAAPPDKGCTLSTLQGDVGFTESGTISGPVPVGEIVEVGVISIDGKGGVTGRAVMNTELSGLLRVEFGEGQYTVNENCLGVAFFPNVKLKALDPSDPLGDGPEILETPRTIVFVIKAGGEISFISTVPQNVLVGSGRRTAGDRGKTPTPKD